MSVVAEAETVKELPVADIGQPLDNPRREAFARAVACGRTHQQAWASAGYSTSYSKHAQSSNAWKLTREPDVAARIAEISAALTHKDALTMQERRLTLAAIVRTPATRFLRVNWSDDRAVQDLGPAAQSIKGLKVKSYEGANGHMVAEADLDLYDKISAIREDAILAGERRTDGTQVNISAEISINQVLTHLRGGSGGAVNAGARPVEMAQVVDGETLPATQQGALEAARAHIPVRTGSTPVPASISEPGGAPSGPLGPVRVSAGAERDRPTGVNLGASADAWESDE